MSAVSTASGSSPQGHAVARVVDGQQKKAQSAGCAIALTTIPASTKADEDFDVGLA